MKKFFTFVAAALLAGTSVASAEKVTVTINNSKLTEIASSYEAEITKDAEGNYVFSNFLDSEVPISFKFDKPEVDGTSLITITSPVEIDDEYAELFDSEGENLTGYVYGLDGVEDWTTLWYLYLYMGEDYTCVYGYDKSEFGYEYYGKFTVYATLSSGKTKWLYLGVWFNEPTSDDQSGVKDAVATQNAPVEYYNLQGVKVANPSNGIFVRRQGNEVKKVVIK